MGNRKGEGEGEKAGKDTPGEEMHLECGEYGGYGAFLPHGYELTPSEVIIT